MIGLNGPRALEQFENVAISSSVDTSTGWRSASFALAAELSLADTHVVIAGSFDFAGDFSISFSVLDLTWDTIIAVHGHFHPGEEKLVAPDIPLSVRSATIAFSRSKGFLFDLEGLELGDYLGASATLAIGPEGGLLRMQVSGGILKLGELEVHNAGVSIAIGRHTTHSSTSSKALVKSSGKACWSLMLFGDLTWRDLQFSVAGRLYTTSEATGLQYTLACVLGTDTAKTGGGFSIDMLIPGIKDSILSDIVFKGVGVFVASMPETDLEILQRVPVGYQIKPGEHAKSLAIVIPFLICNFHPYRLPTCSRNIVFGTSQQSSGLPQSRRHPFPRLHLDRWFWDIHRFTCHP